MASLLKVKNRIVAVVSFRDTLTFLLCCKIVLAYAYPTNNSLHEHQDNQHM